MCMCAKNACVFVCQREKERQGEHSSACASACVCVQARFIYDFLGVRMHVWISRLPV